MGLFNRKKPAASKPLATTESPVTIERISALIGHVNYPVNSRGDDFLIMQLPTCQAIIRDSDIYIEILADSAVPQNYPVEPMEWVMAFNQQNAMPTVLTYANEDIHVGASYRIPTALKFSDEQLLEQLEVGLDSVAKAMQSFHDTYVA